MNATDHLKLRAWVPEANLMTDVAGVFYGRDDVKYIRTMRPVVKTVGHKRHVGGVYQISGNRAILMRRTGLRDKKGVEIYEGDIVKIRYDVGPLEIKEVTGFGFELYMFGAFAEPAKDVEVIRNVYENSELLEAAS